MKISAKKITWTSISCVVALACGMQAIADDTELLMALPDPSTIPKPNVMFILDTSGSMDTDETTKQPYDNTVIYPNGGCDVTAMYWTDVELVPDCGTSTQWVAKSSYHCADSSRLITGIGQYTGTMAQHRSETVAGVVQPVQWQNLAAGDNSSPVECQYDAGVHGDGTAGFLWANSASGASNPWTDTESAKFSWGNSQGNLAYTVYDGNYLNWKLTPAPVTLQRIDILKIVTKKVLESIDNLNVGIMRFNDNEGGPVIHRIADLNANRTAIVAAVDSLTAAGATPLSEVLYENALYWLGATAHYGNTITEHTTDPAGSVGAIPTMAYRQPALDACTKNFNVLLSDGIPNNNEDELTLVPTLPDFFATLGRASCTHATDGDCLDDVSEYLAKYDINSTIAEPQNVTTHTIGFALADDIPILRDAAINSGGRYFVADDIESLTITLLRIVGEINELTQSFSAPAVSVNTFNRTQNLNNLYLTMFGARGKAHWPGNLKKYGIIDGIIVDADDLPAVDPTTGFFKTTARSIWTVGLDDGNIVDRGGAAALLPAPASRNLYTYNGSDTTLTGGSNAIATSNSMAFTDADFGLTGSAGEPTKDDIIDWMRGVDVGDKIAGTNVRNAMGDPLHSQPAAIVYGGTPTNPDVVVYTATNDGYLHAINGVTGIEIWSFVPKELLDNMTRLFFDPSAKYKQYGLDGNVVPIVADRNGNGIVEAGDGDFVYIIMGMRRGGTKYIALDVTDKNTPKILWEKTLSAGGESWSTPVVARMDIDDSGFTFNADKAVVVIGGGYDTVHDTTTHPVSSDAAGAGVHILNLATGATIWHGGPGTGVTKTFSGMTRAMPNQVRVIDVNGDSFADRMYASDMGGQIWRFDIKRGAVPVSMIDGGVIAQLGAEGITSPLAADTRRFYNAPDLSVFRDPLQGRRFISISIGSGYRAHPFDTSAADRFYSVRDPDVFNSLDQNAYDNYTTITESDLVEIGGQTQVAITSSNSGWKFTLPANEKVLADSITFDDNIFFVAFTPDTIANSNCSAGRGTNFLYRVNIVNGDPVVNNLNAILPGDEDDARRTTLAQGGIAPTPTVLFPSPTDPTCIGPDCVPPPIMCVGVECDPPGFDPFPVRTLWTQDGIQ